MLYQSYKQTLSAAVENADNITLMAQRAVYRNIAIISTALDRLAFRFEYAPTEKVPRHQLEAYLFGNGAEHIIFSAIIGKDGEVIAQSVAGANEITQNVGRQDFFITPRDALAPELFISTPRNVNLDRPYQAIVLSKNSSTRAAHTRASR